ncbi:hypothetical protein N4S61_07495 [Burkholderia pseudomallei]|uniref:hypothetical protein n=1 Tax=Burkholderia TaxID=32008 RepID=UPI00034C5D37|nr:MULTISPECIES: hypothetical protein [Burkholderia]ANW50104.1 hypothetical protein A7U58_08500 [Burkholderia pseudomallei]ANW56114.1 hypothetical protein A7U59_08485 [Burkholderia pseudomallei]MCS6599923.1 hypothetical protein [Burkholderia pseudomallei]MCT7345863.1 hypothetical protein [Burkholderia pseudomallei]MCT7917862.1 hypothetical protein [Burkholderia pseudomallei]
MFDHIAKYAHDDDKTKAIFEHFRNLLTAGAVLGAGQWLSKQPVNAHGYLIQLGGGVLSIIGIWLILLAVMNAQAKMVRTGIKGVSLVLMWMTHIFFVSYGLFAYWMLR